MRFLFFWRKTAQQPEQVIGESPAPLPEKPSRILRGVLDGPSPGEAEAKPCRSDTGQVSLSNRLGVGARLNSATARAVEAAKGLSRTPTTRPRRSLPL